MTGWRERAGLKEEISERPCGKREKADLDPPSSACMDDRLIVRLAGVREQDKREKAPPHG